jgi:DNA repair protein RadA/Sms
MVAEDTSNITHRSKGKTSISLELSPLQRTTEKPSERLVSGIAEFDHLLGGGLIPGGITLIGGDPGIGKSTLLLQIAADISKRFPAVYISGEEGEAQVRLRAERLGRLGTPLQFASSTSVEQILDVFKTQKGLRLAIVDSIQTISLSHIQAAPGTVSQIREASHALIQTAKQHNIALVLVGHVTKEGVLAGPRLLEHMVDTVLYFEGERGYPFRLLRAVKNRFGATDELGVFDMTEQGLLSVTNPSSLFLSQRSQKVTGSSVLAGMEGSRPLLVEIQALVSPSFLQMPRRSVLGADPQRLAMILAVLETRCKLHLSQKDIYLNIVGGLKMTEPGADLSVALSLISCVKNIPLRSNLVSFGELSLSGEIRPVGHTEKRLKEAAKLGFTEAVGAFSKPPETSLTLHPMAHIRDLVKFVEDMR